MRAALLDLADRGVLQERARSKRVSGFSGAAHEVSGLGSQQSRACNRRAHAYFVRGSLNLARRKRVGDGAAHEVGG